MRNRRLSEPRTRRPDMAPSSVRACRPLSQPPRGPGQAMTSIWSSRQLGEGSELTPVEEGRPRRERDDAMDMDVAPVGLVDHRLECRQPLNAQISSRQCPPSSNRSGEGVSE